MKTKTVQRYLKPAPVSQKPLTRVMRSRDDRPLTPCPSPPIGARGEYFFFDNRPLQTGEGARRAGEAAVAAAAHNVAVKLSAFSIGKFSVPSDSCVLLIRLPAKV